MPKIIQLHCGDFSLPIKLYNNEATEMLCSILPQRFEVTQWGEELYGPLSRPLVVSNPVAHLEPGSVAYSETGHYLCVFFGQQPAWPVELLGKIPDPEWKKLRGSNVRILQIVK